ncbi:hypothetical protein PHSC3_001844 [Chlamydiales bacterium STE3]|nr:hypothetical protein PHSC3_001844 [Chlamydiales bacterium STE3]
MANLLHIFCVIYYCFCLSTCYASEIDCSSQNALSTLSHCIEKLSDDVEILDEDMEEIAELWDTLGEKSIDQPSIDLAKNYYELFLENPEEGQEHIRTSLGLLDYCATSGSAYPNFDNNPFITRQMRNRMRPFLVPLNHPLKPILDSLFATRVTENYSTIVNSGFHILSCQESSFIKVVTSPHLPEYIFKIYPDDEIRKKQNLPGWHWLSNRCEGARRIKRFIKKNKIKYFKVPEKWLYPLPPFPNPNSPAPQPVILIEDNMHIVSLKETREAWYTKVTKKHLDELYHILSNDMGSSFLSGNIPYCKDGKFAFVDTEYPKRKISLRTVKSYLSPEMQAYWQSLLNHKKKKK